jgi:hypothetical protein
MIQRILGDVLPLFTSGIDYLPGAHRPWVVDFQDPERRQGRGKTLIEAWIMYWRKR